MLILPSVSAFAFYRFNEMDEQEACPGFMTLEEDIVENDKDIVMD